jgi:hypothetical protein
VTLHITEEEKKSSASLGTSVEPMLFSEVIDTAKGQLINRFSGILERKLL